MNQPTLTLTRQVLRRAMRQIAFAEISQQFGGEPRKARRKMASSLMKKEWRKAHGL